MKFLFLAITLLTPLRAAELNPAQISPQANWWFHADLDGARASLVGKRMVTEIQSRMGPKLTALKRMFSVNPLTDLSSITLYGDGRQDHAVALIHGQFDRAHLEDLVKAADQYDATDHAGLVIHQWLDKGKTQFASFAADDLLAFSHDPILLRQAIDVLSSGIGMAADEFVTASPSRPIIAAAVDMTEIEMDQETSRLVREARGMKFTLAETGDRMAARMRIDVQEPKQGERLRQVVTGIVALGQLGDETINALDLLFDARSSDRGRTITTTMSLPSMEMLQLMDAYGIFENIGT